MTELPSASRSVPYLLGALLTLGVFVVLYAARDLVLPVTLAFVLKLLFQPFVRLLERARVPKVVGALAAVCILLAGMAGMAILLSGPTANWASELPAAWQKMQRNFAFLHQFAVRLQGPLKQVGIDSSGNLLSGLLKPSQWLGAVFSSTGSAASMLLQVVVILFYFLVFSETVLRRIVEVLPSFSDKRDAVAISLRIERDLSTYLLTVTVINAVVGLAAAGVTWVTGIPGPPLWGVVAFCANFVPILGPICMVGVFLLLGMIVKGPVWIALLPAGLYLCVHLAEGEIITPMLLARRFTLNPIAVILSLILWYWMWGVAGVVLAVPILAIFKVFCDGLRPLQTVGHLLDG